MSIYRLVALSSPKAGQEEEFKRWYIDQHVPDVMRVPGAVAAECHSIEAPGGTAEWSWMAIYTFETDDPAQPLADIQARLGTDEMPLSDALDASKAALLLATPAPQ